MGSPKNDKFSWATPWIICGLELMTGATTASPVEGQVDVLKWEATAVEYVVTKCVEVRPEERPRKWVGAVRGHVPADKGFMDWLFCTQEAGPACCKLVELRAIELDGTDATDGDLFRAWVTWPEICMADLDESRWLLSGKWGLWLDVCSIGLDWHKLETAAVLA